MFSGVVSWDAVNIDDNNKKSKFYPQRGLLGNLKAPAGMTLVVRGFCPKSFLPDVISEKFKGPCGHDNPSFGASAPNHFFPDVIFEKFKGPSGHDNPSFGASAPNHFCQDSWQSQMLSTGWPAGRPILILSPPPLLITPPNLLLVAAGYAQ